MPGPHVSQISHEAWPAEGWKKLVAHDEQLDAAAPENFPAPQSWQEPAFVPLYLPLGQFVHASAPDGAYVPPGHSRQVVAPSPACVPASQDDAQEEEPGALNLPASQLIHASLLTDEYLPPAHSLQMEAPLLLSNPGTQGVQVGDPEVLYFPAGQVLHPEDTGEEY